MRTFLIRSACSQQGDTNRAVPEAIVEGGGGLKGDGFSHDGAGYGEKHEGILTEYEVCTKVHLVCTPQERMILDHIMFQLISHQLARTLKHEARQHGLVTFNSWFV